MYSLRGVRRVFLPRHRILDRVIEGTNRCGEVALYTPYSRHKADDDFSASLEDSKT